MPRASEGGSGKRKEMGRERYHKSQSQRAISSFVVSAVRLSQGVTKTVAIEMSYTCRKIQ